MKRRKEGLVEIRRALDAALASQRLLHPVGFRRAAKAASQVPFSTFPVRVPLCVRGTVDSSWLPPKHQLKYRFWLRGTLMLHEAN